MSTRQRLCLALRLGQLKAEPLIYNEMPEKFQVLAALNEVYGFSFNNSVCRHKESITDPSTYNI